MIYYYYYYYYYFAYNSLFELFRDTPAGFIIQFLRECNLYYMFQLLDSDL